MKTGGSAAVDAAALRDRLRGLKPKQAEQLRQVMRDMARGDLLMAGQWLLQLALTAPDHPEVLRWRGARHAAVGEWADAAVHLARSAALRPHDFPMLLQLAQAQEQLGDHAAALRSLQAAIPAASNQQERLALSSECERQGAMELALQAVNGALARDSSSPSAALPLLQRARCQQALGMADGAAADCRALIAAQQFEARAWFTLLDLKTVKLLPGELDLLQQTAGAPRIAPADRHLLDFALGKALEDAGRHAEALPALHRANAAAQHASPWDGAAFSQRVQHIQQAFSPLPPVQAQAQAQAAPHDQGREVIFLVGLPRSGTTLVEQVLASHSQVEGASELGYLPMVIAEESRRRGQDFPAWVQQASADDWARLGQRYLALSAGWRQQRPIATDKLPENWLLAGAALAMLPQARVIDCRRDALETCWSCYKQLFGPQQVGFTYSFEGLATYWHGYDALCNFWAQQLPQRFRAQSYERLVAEPEAQIRALLDFCGLPFEPGCLQAHTAQRAIRTPSALQVRQPMRQTSTPAAGYGALLDPLRRLLAAADRQPLPESPSAAP